MNELLSNPSFIGSLSGAVISGLVAVGTMKINHYVQKKEKELESLENYIKDVSLLSYSIKWLIHSIHKYTDWQIKQELIMEPLVTDGDYRAHEKELNYIKYVKQLKKKEIDIHLFRIKEFNISNFGVEVSGIYLRALGLIETRIQGDLESSIQDEKWQGSYGDMLNKYCLDLKQFSYSLDEELKIKREQYDKLK